MADNFNYVQGVDYKLSGSGITSTDVSITLQKMRLPDDSTNTTMSMFGSIGYGVLEPGTIREENISFTGITQNGDGTATLTGVTRGLKFVSPYDQDLNLRKAHSGGTTFRISNIVQFYNKLVNKDNDETITQTHTYTDPNVPRMDAAHTYGAGEEEYFATKRYADSLAIAGAPDASTTQKGIVEEATPAEAAAGTATGSTGARLAIPAAMCNSSSSATTLIPVTDASGIISVGFMPVAQNWSITGTFDIAPATNWKLGGVAYTGAMADLNEASTFFQATNISGAEAETLTNGSEASALHIHYGRVIGLDNTAVTVSNTITETTLKSISIPANTLSTNRGIRMFLNISTFQVAAIANTASITIRCKYGATTLVTLTLSESGTYDVSGAGWIYFDLLATGATNSQKGLGYFFGGRASASPFSSPVAPIISSGQGTSTENSTGALNMIITAQMGLANASNNITMYNAIITAL